MWRPPNWSRDEVVLALDLYFRVRNHDAHQAEVAELSRILNLMAPETSVQFPRYRNPAGVNMKLGNLARFDPDNTDKGLSAGSVMDERV